MWVCDRECAEESESGQVDLLARQLHWLEMKY